MGSKHDVEQSMENRKDAICRCGKSWMYIPHNNVYGIHMYAFYF